MTDSENEMLNKATSVILSTLTASIINTVQTVSLWPQNDLNVVLIGDYKFILLHYRFMPCNLLYLHTGAIEVTN